ncbi:MAG: MFS transporter [Candidatus Bathyarchaeia archaeon]
MKGVSFKRGVTLLLIMLSHQFYAADQLIIGAVLDSIMKDLSFSVFWGGVITTLFGLGMVLSSLFTGWIVKKMGLAYTLLVGFFTLSFFTVLTGVSSSIFHMLFFRFGVGIGGGVWNVAYYSFFGSIYPERRGLMSGLAGNMYITGILWSFPVASIVLSCSSSWKMPFYLFGLLSLSISALIFLIIRLEMFERVERREVVEKQQRGYLWRILGDRNVILGCVISLFAAIISYSVTSFYPTYSRTVLNYDVVFSSTLTSAQMCLMLIMTPLILFLSDRYGRKPFLYYSSLPLAPLVYLMFQPRFGNPHLVILLCIVYGAVNAGGYPLVLSFIQDLVTPSMTPIATSLCTAIFNIGSLLSGPTAGYFVSLMGWEKMGFWLFSCCLAYFLAAFMAKETRRQR